MRLPRPAACNPLQSCCFPLPSAEPCRQLKLPLRSSVGSGWPSASQESGLTLHLMLELAGKKSIWPVSCSNFAAESLKGLLSELHGTILVLLTSGSCRSDLERLWPGWSFEGVSEEIWWLDHTEDRSEPQKVVPESEGMEASCSKL